MSRKGIGWRAVALLPGLLPAGTAAAAGRELAAAPATAAADGSCTLTPSPSGWRQSGQAYYRLVMDRAWLFLPTGQIEIDPVTAAFQSAGTAVVALNSGGGVPLFGDPDLHSPMGTQVRYPAGSGDLDYWLWADFPADAEATVDLIHPGRRTSHDATLDRRRAVRQPGRMQCRSAVALRALRGRGRALRASQPELRVGQWRRSLRSSLGGSLRLTAAASKVCGWTACRQ